jgi:hypothetical protein
MFHGPLDLHAATVLRELQGRIQALNLPPSKLDESLLVASWNIREFGRSARDPLALHLVAEILGQFDLISIVELREDLGELATVLSYLGPYWSVVYSDLTEDDAGNWERLAFIYDQRAVQFCGLAGSGIAPREKVGDEYIGYKSFWRAPFSVAFRSGNFDFVAIAAHMRWGKSKAARLDEISRFASWVDFKLKREKRVDSDVLVFGDFNTEQPAMLDALLAHGLQVPTPLQDIKTNLQGSKHYDHILHNPVYTRAFTDQGGVAKLFTTADRRWFPGVAASRFTYQLSDHYPVWALLRTDNDTEQLDQLIRSARRG